MPIADLPATHRAPHLALAASLLIHLIILFLPAQAPTASLPASTRLQASLAPKPTPAPEPHETSEPAKPAGKAAKNPRSRVLTAAQSPSATPTWTRAQKAEMDGFLNELSEQAKARPKPTLAQKAITSAREQGRQMARQDDREEALLELRPDGPAVNPFSLEMYLEGLVRRLNRSAGFVRNDPRSRGVRPASIQFRLNPDGSLKSFVVLNAGDQAEEIEFIRSVVQRAVPFSPFPPDIDKAARSLGVVICIRPGIGEGSLGFTRMEGGRCR